MTWRCIPVNCVKRIAKIKHLAPVAMAGLVAGNPLPTDCASRCHWVWDGPIQPSPSPTNTPSPDLLPGPGNVWPITVLPPGSGTILLPPPTWKDTGKPVHTVPEPSSALLLLFPTLGLFTLLRLWKLDKTTVRPTALRPPR